MDHQRALLPPEGNWLSAERFQASGNAHLPHNCEVLKLGCSWNFIFTFATFPPQKHFKNVWNLQVWIQTHWGWKLNHFCTGSRWTLTSRIKANFILVSSSSVLILQSPSTGFQWGEDRRQFLPPSSQKKKKKDCKQDLTLCFYICLSHPSLIPISKRKFKPFLLHIEFIMCLKATCYYIAITPFTGADVLLG